MDDDDADYMQGSDEVCPIYVFSNVWWLILLATRLVGLWIRILGWGPGI